MARGQLHKLITAVTAGICVLLIVLTPMAAPTYASESISETEEMQQERNVLVTVIEHTDDEQVPLANINLDNQENVPGCGVHFIILAVAGVMAIWMISDIHRQKSIMKNLQTELKSELDSRKNRIA